MPVHRSITRINNTENKYNALNLCCCICLFYIILSIILSSSGVNETIIVCIILTTFSSGGCIFYVCVTQIEREIERDNHEINIETDNIPAITAYPIPENYTNHLTLDAVVCQPDFSS